MDSKLCIAFGLCQALRSSVRLTLTLIPFFRNVAVISEMAYCAFATAIPYPTTYDRSAESRKMEFHHPHQDYAIGIRQCLNRLIHIRLSYRSFDFFSLCCRGTDAAEQDVHGGTVHCDAL
jgi:hypothetical protein